MLYFALAMAVGAVVSYMVGAIPFAFLGGQMMGIDVRKVGSGNIGATNLARALGGGTRGTVAFVATSLLDAAKGWAPAFLLAWWAAEVAGGYPSQLIYFQLVFGLAAIMGHVFPIYLGFHGGKAVNTSLGVALGLAWGPALIALAAWIILFTIWRYVSLGSLVAAVVYVAGVALIPPWRGQWVLLGFSILVAGLIIFRHTDNIKRLMAGTEKRIGGEKQL